jgi:hypothetical protein
MADLQLGELAGGGLPLVVVAVVGRVGPGAYCIFDGAQSEPEPDYVGEAARLSARAASHLAARRPVRDPWIAYRAFRGARKHVLHELESNELG